MSMPSQTAKTKVVSEFKSHRPLQIWAGGGGGKGITEILKTGSLPQRAQALGLDVGFMFHLTTSLMIMMLEMLLNSPEPLNL